MSNCEEIEISFKRVDIREYQRILEQYYSIPEIVLICNEAFIAKIYRNILSLINLTVAQEYDTPTKFLEEYPFDEARLFIHSIYPPVKLCFEIIRTIRMRSEDSYVISLSAVPTSKEDYEEAGCDCWIEQPARLKTILNEVVKGITVMNSTNIPAR